MSQPDTGAPYARLDELTGIPFADIAAHLDHTDPAREAQGPEAGS